MICRIERNLGPGVKRLVSLKEIGLHALFKPPGVLSHPNIGSTLEKSLLQSSYSHNRECYRMDSVDDPAADIWLLHRLDKATSGVILVSDNEKTARYIKRLFLERAVKKRYIAAVFGKLDQPNAVWRDHLAVSKGESEAQSATPSVGERFAETKVKLLQWNANANISLIELRPVTGIRHQLRLQCQRHRVPIIGDRAYGSFKLNKTVDAFRGKKNYMFLHAAEISLPAPSGQSFSVKAPIPDEFRDIFPSSVKSHL
jgi:23S rRNA-/tRNA-specific pseudouridylate synthase